MGIRVEEIVKRLEKRFPKENAEGWDNVGLLVGESKAEVKKVQISLDATESVVDEAIRNNVDMIITHHPMIFSPLKAINDRSIIGKKILKLVKNNIALYSMHTNLDSSKGGLNEYICKKLGWEDSKLLEANCYDYYKLGVFIPLDEYDKVKKVIESSGLELNGYEGVSYSSSVVESYKKTEDNRIDIEVRKIEVIGEKGKLHQVLNDIKKVHSYEEVAYEIIKIENKYEKSGIGRVVNLSEKIELGKLVEGVKESLGIDSVRLVAKDKSKKIKKIAIVNGSGMSFAKKAKRVNADLFITGDVRYHEAVDALEEGSNILDIGHYESEHFFYELIEESLAGVEVDIYNEGPVFNYV